MNISDYIDMLFNGTKDTLYMTITATFLSYLIGLPLGIIIVITEKGHILPHPKLNAVLGWIINITRSIPFIILLIAIVPFTRLVAGTTIGSTASIVPLVVAAIPFVARLVETSLKELDRGIIEAVQSIGASPWQIVIKVMVPETMPSILLGVSITAITVIGYSAMAGVTGGGGLGDIAVRYGFYRYQEDLMFLTIVLLVIIVQLVQTLGSGISRKLDRKKR